MTPTKQNAPTGGRSACEMNFGGFIRNRNAAARRMEPLECGCRDPWLCRCHGDKHVSTEARLAAELHLAAAGLAPTRRTAA